MRFTRHSQETEPPLSTLILADDLTGACDSAAAFATRGQETRVAIGCEGPGQVRHQVVSYSLEARNLQPEEAARQMRAAAERTRGLTASVLFCKIDSAGRGWAGEAVLNYLGGSKCGWAVFAPSFPDQGRTMRNGVLEIAEGPGTLRQIPVENLFPHHSRILLGRIACGDADERRREMRTALDAGKRILLCDAGTQEDLAAVVQAAMRIDQNRVLWCGSAGLAHALAEAYCPPLNAAMVGPSQQNAGKITLVFAGTPHSSTAGQLETLAEMKGVVRMQCGCEQGAFAAESRCIVAGVHCGKTSDAQVRDVWKHAQSAGGARALVLTGGDTASLVLRALAAQSILIKGEITRGIPWGVIEGGTAAGHRVVTKSGGFGDRNALVEIVRYLERMP